MLTSWIMYSIWTISASLLAAAIRKALKQGHPLSASH